MEDQLPVMPPLHHPETAALAQFELDLPPETLEAILALPRETLIEDLETLVRHHLDLLKQDALDEENCTIFHSLMLLGHLQSEQSLPLVLDVFRLSEDDMDFLFGDMFLEDLWQVPLLCGQSQLDKLAGFVLDESVEWEFARDTVAEALAQSALHFPERKPEVVGHLARMLHHYNELSVFNEDSMPQIVATLTDAALILDARELLPVIEELYEKDRVDMMLRGDWEEFKADWDTDINDKRTMFPDVRDWYETQGIIWQKRVLENRLDALRYETARKQRELNEAKRELQRNLAQSHLAKTGEKKVGRNDPCPCGSGKKYKKCHGA